MHTGMQHCTGHTAHRGSRGIALLFHDHGTRRGWGVSVTPWPLFTPGKDLVPIVQETGWAPGTVWSGAENLAPTGIRSPDRPARSQSLYWLRYLAHKLLHTNWKYVFLLFLSQYRLGVPSRINDLYCWQSFSLHNVLNYPKYLTQYSSQYSHKQVLKIQGNFRNILPLFTVNSQWK